MMGRGKRSQDSLQHKGTVLGAKDIVLSATNMTLSATEAVALNNITAIAKENFVVDGAVNQSHQNEWEKRKQRGLTASAANGIASVGIGRSKSGTNEDTANTRLQLSRFNALGNLTFVAEDGDLTLNAAQLQSGNDMHVQGKNVYLNALTENESRHVSHYAPR